MLTDTAAKPSGEHPLFHVNGPLSRVTNMTREAAECSAQELRLR